MTTYLGSRPYTIQNDINHSEGKLDEASAICLHKLLPGAHISLTSHYIKPS